MKRIFFLTGLVFLLGASLAWPQAIRDKAPKESTERRVGDLKVGDPAPDFEVQDAHGKETVKLSKLRGKPVVLIFGSCT